MRGEQGVAGAEGPKVHPAPALAADIPSQPDGRCPLSDPQPCLRPRVPGDRPRQRPPPLWAEEGRLSFVGPHLLCMASSSCQPRLVPLVRLLSPAHTQ